MALGGRRIVAPDTIDCPSALRMPCVLIVEDDPDIREFMALIVPLVMPGYSVLTAANGLDALQQLRVFKPDLVLLDLHMPVMNGWEFRMRQLADPECASIPVVVLTAYYDPQKVTAELGIPCVPKPIDVDEMLRAVSRATGSN